MPRRHPLRQGDRTLVVLGHPRQLAVQSAKGGHGIRQEAEQGAAHASAPEPHLRDLLLGPATAAPDRPPSPL